MFVGQGKMPGKTCSQQENAAGRHQHVRHFKSEFLSKAFINVGDPTTRKITKPGHVCDTRTPNCPQLFPLIAIRNVRPLNFVAVFVDTELQAEILIHFCCSYFFSVFEAVAFAAVWSTLLFFFDASVRYSRMAKMFTGVNYAAFETLNH